MKLTVKEKMVDHPMEDVFDIVPGSTVVEYKELVPAPVSQSPLYDEKDTEIEAQLEEIYNVAMSGVVAISDEMDRVEGKYKARIGEVTSTMLNVALTAVRDKAHLKMHKDKLSPIATNADGTRTITNNNLVVADRNEILRMLMDKTNK